MNIKIQHFTVNLDNGAILNPIPVLSLEETETLEGLGTIQEQEEYLNSLGKGSFQIIPIKPNLWILVRAFI